MKEIYDKNYYVTIFKIISYVKCIINYSSSNLYNIVLEKSEKHLSNLLCEQHVNLKVINKNSYDNLKSDPLSIFIYTCPKGNQTLIF